MASDPCEACGADVPIGGGISGFWSSAPRGTGGMTLTFPRGADDQKPEMPPPMGTSAPQASQGSLAIGPVAAGGS